MLGQVRLPNLTQYFIGGYNYFIGNPDLLPSNFKLLSISIGIKLFIDVEGGIVNMSVVIELYKKLCNNKSKNWPGLTRIKNQSK